MSNDVNDSVERRIALRRMTLRELQGVARALGIRNVTTRTSGMLISEIVVAEASQSHGGRKTHEDEDESGGAGGAAGSGQ